MNKNINVNIYPYFINIATRFFMFFILNFYSIIYTSNIYYIYYIDMILMLDNNNVSITIIIENNILIIPTNKLFKK